MLADLHHVSAVIAAGGQITLGCFSPLPGCFAVASNDIEAIVMLKRGDGEDLDHLLKRLMPKSAMPSATSTAEPEWQEDAQRTLTSKRDSVLVNAIG